METNTAYAAGPVSAEASITLKKDVSALEIVRRENARGHFGGVALISKGSRLEICGSGFNERTYKVKCQNRLFFVFHQDLGSEPRHV
jgi:hypothetical protein